MDLNDEDNVVGDREEDRRNKERRRYLVEMKHETQEPIKR